MAKFGIGESVHFRDSVISVSVTPGMSVTIKTDNLSGRVTGVADCGPEETEYHVDVNIPAKGVVLKVKIKESALLSHSEYVHKVIDDMIKTTKEIRAKILRTDSAKPIYSFLFSDFALPMTKDKIEEYEKKLNENARNFLNSIDSAMPGGDKNGMGVVDGKMSKFRCVKLLEAYRAEREKVKKGRKFERCLRDSVVDEALERAIELLKGGAE
jgi:hypothetical protein